MVVSQPGAGDSLSKTLRVVFRSETDRDSLPPSSKSFETPVDWKRPEVSSDHASFDVGGDQGGAGRDLRVLLSNQVFAAGEYEDTAWRERAIRFRTHPARTASRPVLLSATSPPRGCGLPPQT